MKHALAFLAVAILIVAVVFVAWLTFSAFRAPPEPTSEASAPAPVAAPTASSPIDPASPRGVAQSFVIATNTGNRDAILALCRLKDANERDIATALADASAAIGRLRNAVRVHFGTSAGDSFMLIPANNLDGATEVITGDSALLKPPGQAAIPLARVGGRWKIALAETVQSSSLTSDQMITLYRQMVPNIARIQSDVDAGAFTSANDVLTALQNLNQKSASAVSNGTTGAPTPAGATTNASPIGPPVPATAP